MRTKVRESESESVNNICIVVRARAIVAEPPGRVSALRPPPSTLANKHA